MCIYMHIYAQVICKHYDILYKGFENLKILVSLEVPQPISHGYGLQFLVHKSWGKHKLRTGHLTSYWGICGPGWSAISPTWLQMTSCEMLVRIVLVHVAAHPRLSSTLLSLCCMSPEKKVLSSPCSPVQSVYAFYKAKCVCFLLPTSSQYMFMFGFCVVSLVRKVVQ